MRTKERFIYVRKVVYVSDDGMIWDVEEDTFNRILVIE